MCQVIYDIELRYMSVERALLYVRENIVPYLEQMLAAISAGLHHCH